MEHEAALVLAAALTLAYGLISRRAEQSPITAPMLFVAAGAIFCPRALHLFELEMDAELVEVLAKITLLLILFTDASTVRLRALDADRNLPLRLLFVGLPLTMVLGTVLAVGLFPEVGILGAALVALILSPTDAALGQAVVTSEGVPLRVRQSINVESGLNDGIALPPILVCVALLASAGSTDDAGHWIGFTLGQLAFGPLAGIAVGFLGGRLVDLAAGAGWMNPTFQRLAAVSLAILSFAAAEAIGGNGFIAAYFAGLFLGTRGSSVRERIHEFGEAEGELLSLFVFLLFGMTMVPASAPYWDAKAVAYALLSLTVVRMVPVALSLIGSGLDRRAVAFVGWFGPRGIASVLYLVLILHMLPVSEYWSEEQNERLVSVVVLTVLLSVFLHGLTAVPLSRLYGRSQAQ